MQDDRNQNQSSDSKQSNPNQQETSFSNPQDGAEWDNYQTRTLSGKPGREGGDEALSSQNTDQGTSSEE